jgi:hypothetical protein
MCSSAKVNIYGMPRDIRVANALVAADYRMKLVWNNLAVLPIAHRFPTSRDLDIEESRQDLIHNRPVHGGSLTKLWFNAGRFSYQISPDYDVAFMDCAQIVLSDKLVFLAQHQFQRAADKVDHPAQAFACAWTARMEDVYKAEPIWRDMHNIYRQFALARIMFDNGAIGRANLDSSTINYLLDANLPTEVTTPTTLPNMIVIDYVAAAGKSRMLYNHGGVVANAGYSKSFEKSSQRPSIDIKDTVRSLR